MAAQDGRSARTIQPFGCCLGIGEFLSSMWNQFGSYQSLPNIQVTDDLEQRLSENSFRVGAGLKLYEDTFGTDFSKKLSKNSRWLDAGAGEANAMLDYRDKSDPVEMVAVSYKKPTSNRLELAEKNKVLTYHEGFFDTMSELGKFDLITDHNGVLFYSRDITRDLSKYLDMLTKDGVLYIANFIFVDETNSKDVSAIEWLSDVSGIQLELSGNAGLRITKTGGEIRIPQLVLVAESSDFSASPPDRHFKRVGF